MKLADIAAKLRSTPMFDAIGRYAAIAKEAQEWSAAKQQDEIKQILAELAWTADAIADFLELDLEDRPRLSTAEHSISLAIDSARPKAAAKPLVDPRLQAILRTIPSEALEAVAEAEKENNQLELPLEHHQASNPT